MTQGSNGPAADDGVDSAAVDSGVVTSLEPEPDQPEEPAEEPAEEPGEPAEEPAEPAEPSEPPAKPETRPYLW